MSHPQFCALVPEKGPFGGSIKFFISTLLFSTGKRGRIVESMVVICRHDEQILRFPYWMHGQDGELAIGSGVFVGPEGIGTNYHFVPINEGNAQLLTPGRYEVEVCAHLLGDKNPLLLQKFQFNLSLEEISALNSSRDSAVYLIWDSENQSYKSMIDSKRSKTFSLE